MNAELEAKYRKAAQQALDVQDACNLSGVAHALSRTLSDVIWPAARELNQGTDWVNTHPIVVTYLDKLTSLARIQQVEYAEIFKAHEACERIAGGEDPVGRKPATSAASAPAGWTEVQA